MIKSPKHPLQLAVCCLNICEGRNYQTLEYVAKAAIRNQESWKRDVNIKSNENVDDDELACKATVLSVYTDKVFNRGNVTIAATTNYLSTSVYQASLAAFEKINLQDHLNPGHPRLGVVDLIPIHPISSTVSLESCGIIARNVAERIAANVEGTSMFLFGHADKEKRGLVQRRKEMNWFDMKSDINISSSPDLGHLTARYGLTAIGAIPYMSVMNIVLDTDDLAIGGEIAARLRGSNRFTGLPGIQTMAFKKEEGVEIACNVDTNDLQSNLPVFMTSFEDLEAAIKESALGYNIKILKENVRGFSPHEAYGMASRALKVGDMSPWRSKDIYMM